MSDLGTAAYAGRQMSEKRYFVGRVIVRQEGSARLLASGQVVALKKCPCDDGKYLLLELVGEEYQPVWWET